MSTMGLLDDKRPIKSITVQTHDETTYWTLSERVSLIEVEKVPGPTVYVPWFSIHNGQEITARVNGMFVVDVDYVQPSEVSDVT